MSFLLGLFLLALVNVSFQQGAQPITLAQNTATLNSNSARIPIISFTAPLLAGPAQLSFQSTANLQICIQRGIQVPIDVTSWATDCSIYKVYQSTSGQTTYSLTLRSFAHQMSFWFLNSTTASVTAAVNYTLTSSTCPGTAVGSECVTPIALSTSTNNAQVTTTSDVTYFRIEAADVAKASRISFSFKLDNDTTLSLPVAASFGATPTFLTADINEVQSFLTNFPMPLTWIILVNNQRQNFKYSFDIQTCDVGTYGYYCNTTVSDLTSFPGTSQMISTPSGLGTVTYFRYNVTSQNKQNQFWMNAQTINRGPNDQIKIFAKYGNLPSVSSPVGYDYARNNITFVVNFLTEGVWFFAVLSDTKFGVWLDDRCPHSCSGAGQCVDRVCTCNAGYFQIDCSVTVTGTGDVQPSEKPILLGVGLGGAGAIILAVGIYLLLEYNKKREAERTALFAHELPERVPDSERLDEHSY